MQIPSHHSGKRFLKVTKKRTPPPSNKANIGHFDILFRFRFRHPICTSKNTQWMSHAGVCLGTSILLRFSLFLGGSGKIYYTVQCGGCEKRRLVCISRSLYMFWWRVASEPLKISKKKYKVHNKDLKSIANTTLVRPLLDNASTVCFPYTVTNIANLKLCSTGQPAGLPMTTSAHPAWHKSYRTSTGILSNSGK